MSQIAHFMITKTNLFARIKGLWYEMLLSSGIIGTELGIFHNFKLPNSFKLPWFIRL